MIAEAFARAAQGDDRFVVTALHSLSIDSMNRVGQYASHATRHPSRQLFFSASDVDAIIVCTPHARHATDAVDAIKAEKHVLIEKPLAIDIAELVELERASTACQKSIVALPHPRYPFIGRLKEIIASGRLGKITTIHSVLDVPGPARSNWYYSPTAGGGASLDTLPYALSRVFDVLPADVTMAVGSRTQTIHRRRCLDGGDLVAGVDDAAALTLQFSSGQVAFARSTWNSWLPADHLIVCGRRGDVKVDCWRNRMIVRCVGDLPAGGEPDSWDGTAAVKFQFTPFDSEALKLQAFASAIERGEKDIKQTIYLMRLILGIPAGGGIVPVPSSIFRTGGGEQAFVLGDEYV
jgi:predicted dehydrogenase